MQKNKKAAGTGSRLRPIELSFQPIFDIHLNMAIDFEVSMNINDKVEGVMLPELFLPVARKTNQICDLFKWTVEECCDVYSRCEKREADVNSFIVPIPVRQLAKPGCVEQITKIIEKKGAKPELFCFDIKESILEDVKEQVIENIKSLRALGFKVSIDDFGVEYTSLTHLSHYEVDYIGVNADLIDNVLEDERVQNMIQGLIDFTHKIETEIRVDGVDSAEKANLLKVMGVDQFKGSLYGGPSDEKKIS